MTEDELKKQYFPFTDNCGHDGQPCIRNKCKYWLDTRACWDDEFNSLVEKIFNCERYDYIRYETELPYLRFFLHPQMLVGDKEDFSTPPQIYIEIGLNSQRLAEKIKEKFNLTQWNIQSRCEDGGDDHDLVLITHASHLEKNEIVNLLTNIKDLMPKIIAAAKEINTCNLCKKHTESLTEYGDYSICYGCEKRIIVENLPNYFLDR